ncbi:MAG TPA: bifunctional diaminohydroxyphosphoribosylaminopyrimidine deaminase/5-amino-6-(5-phosphoribosylamino)uracil reductase RibD [bacterium]|nr:bifunctional diaminohydroxyphosphoribosylaminopyrimidine deaminase/5-amino-6-(5-phosphoribosylamino)uracil reductase RibD [bacterium]
MTVRTDDLRWMKRALALAKRAHGSVEHYPMVGAVVVKNGRLVAEGYFERPGGPHAEVNALKKAGARARGADLILNLEPCSHFGRTPPCADAVIAAGIKRVAAGMRDPNPLVAGKGFRKLEKAGIEVVRGVLEDECRELNRVFIKFITARAPFVTMKAAMTMDGKIAAASGDSKWVSGKPAREEVHKLRAVTQAVMVGAGTVRRDDPRLTARPEGHARSRARQPRPVVVTSALDIPISSKFMKTPAGGGPLIFCTALAPVKKVEAFLRAGAEVVIVKKDRGGRADIRAVMRELGARKIASVLLEGGSGLFGAALRAGVVDELVLFIAPKIMGGGISVTGGIGPPRIADAIALAGVKARRIGADLMITAKVVNDNR